MDARRESRGQGGSRPRQMEDSGVGMGGGRQELPFKETGEVEKAPVTKFWEW